MLMNEDSKVDPHIADLLSQQALQRLDAETAAQVQRLLTDDPALAREAADLQRAVELLAVVSQCPPPPHLRARVLSAAHNTTSSKSPISAKGIVEPAITTARDSNVHQFPARRWPLFLSTSLAAAASLACAVLILERAELEVQHDRSIKREASLQRQLELETQAASMLLEPNVVLSFPLGGRSDAALASGYVMLDLDARRASIAVHDLPAAPPGHSYHLWAVLESRNVACGRFMPAADGRILTQFMIPVDSYTSPIQKLILTVEPDSDQSAPRGTTVMTS
jgi:hypothetical protein